MLTVRSPFLVWNCAKLTNRRVIVHHIAIQQSENFREENHRNIFFWQTLIFWVQDCSLSLALCSIYLAFSLGICFEWVEKCHRQLFTILLRECHHFITCQIIYIYIAGQNFNLILLPFLPSVIVAYHKHVYQNNIWKYIKYHVNASSISLCLSCPFQVLKFKNQATVTWNNH